MSPQIRRQAVALACEEGGVSQRRACGLMGSHRSTCRYQRRRAEENKQLRQRLRELAEKWRRYGYRHLLDRLVREGWR